MTFLLYVTHIFCRPGSFFSQNGTWYILSHPRSTAFRKNQRVFYAPLLHGDQLRSKKRGWGVSVCNFHRPPWAIMAARSWRCWHSQNATREKVKSKIPENWITCILGWCEHAKRYFHVGLIVRPCAKQAAGLQRHGSVTSQQNNQCMIFFKAKTMEKNLCCHFSIKTWSSLFDSTRSKDLSKSGAGKTCSLPMSPGSGIHHSTTWKNDPDSSSPLKSRIRIEPCIQVVLGRAGGRKFQKKKNI